MIGKKLQRKEAGTMVTYHATAALTPITQQEHLTSMRLSSYCQRPSCALWCGCCNCKICCVGVCVFFRIKGICHEISSFLLFEHDIARVRRHRFHQPNSWAPNWRDLSQSVQANAGIPCVVRLSMIAVGLVRFRTHNHLAPVIVISSAYQN